MRLKKSVLLIAASFSLVFSHAAFAQDQLAPSDDPTLDAELVNSELGSDEAPPPAEYPYPGAKEEGITAPAANQAAVDAPLPRETERPVKIDEDSGDYHYDVSTKEKPEPLARGGDRNPEKVFDDGEYQYARDEKIPAYSGRKGIEAPANILANGEYHYPTEKSPITGSATFRVGFFGPPNLVNLDLNPHKYFQDIYTHDQLPVLFGAYEWPLVTRAGHLGLKFGTGFFVAQGQGVFKKSDAGRRSDDIPPEKYTFVMFPNEITAQYRFQYAEKQPIVPYVEGGFGFYTFAELRDDSSGPRFGGALTSVIAGGCNFLMDWLDPEAIGRLDADYGINHVYFTTEFKQVVGLNKTYDFSSSVINAGFLLQF